MNTKDVKFPIGKIFVYTLIHINSLGLIAITGFMIIMFIIILTQGGLGKFINEIEVKGVIIALSYYLGFVMVATLFYFPLMLYQYYIIRNSIIKLDYTIIKIEKEKFKFKRGKVNYTLKMYIGRYSTSYALTSDNDRINTTVASVHDLEKLLSQIAN